LSAHRQFAPQLRGLTITELLIGLVISSIALFVGARIMTDQRIFALASQTAADRNSSLTLVSKIVTQALSTDSRFHAFTGPPPVRGGDDLSYRFLIPLPGVSRQMLLMPESTALLLASSDSQKAPSLRILCANDAGTEIYADLLGDQRGPTNFAGNTVTVTPTSSSEPAGPYSVAAGTVIGLQMPPRVYMFRVVAGAAIATVINSPTVPPPGIPTSCLGRMRTTGTHPTFPFGPIYATDGLLRIPVRPLAIPNLTGLASQVPVPALAEVLSALPAWSTEVKLKSLGTEIVAGKRNFGMEDCIIGENTWVSCPTTSRYPTVDSVLGNRISLGYSVTFNSALPTGVRYEILRLSEARPPAASCTSDTMCSVLRAIDLPNPDAVPPPPLVCGSLYWMVSLPVGLSPGGTDCSGPREGAGGWNTQLFSLAKQEYVKSISIDIEFEGGKSERIFIGL
jgi:hypothetical protein